jgi:hypothetical protein
MTVAEAEETAVFALRGKEQKLRDFARKGGQERVLLVGVSDDEPPPRPERLTPVAYESRPTW